MDLKRSFGAFGISSLLHMVLIVILALYILQQTINNQQDTIYSEILVAEPKKTKRVIPRKRIELQKRNISKVNTNQPKLKILTSNAPPTNRGVISASKPTEFSLDGPINLNTEAENLGEGISIPKKSAHLGKMIGRSTGVNQKEREREKSKLVKFIERQPGTQQIFYSFDLSSSMRNLSPLKLRKIIAIIQDSLDFLEKHDKFNLVTFSGDINFYHPDMITPTIDHIKRVKEYLNGIKPEQSSRASDQDMLSALNSIKPNNPTIVVLFSDGILTSAGIPQPEEMQKYVPSRTKIFTIATGMSPDFPGAILLKMLSNQSNGEFWLVDN